MTIYTIEQKMSGTGTIHDIESDLYDRDIRFRDGENFAVVLAAYYGGSGYTTHNTAEAAIKQSGRVQDYSHQIIDRAGNRYTIAPDGRSLVRY